jgi:hypothetical protein
MQMTQPMVAGWGCVWRTKVRVLRYDAPANSMAATVLGQVAMESEELKKAVLAEGATPELQRMVRGTNQPSIFDMLLFGGWGLIHWMKHVCVRLVRGRYATQRAPWRRSRQRPLP